MALTWSYLSIVPFDSRRVEYERLLRLKYILTPKEKKEGSLEGPSKDWNTLTKENVEGT
jgi:hypothetical protein